MKKNELGQTITIFANIEVIVGIAFLAVEIRDSNRHAKAASLMGVYSEQSEWLQLLGSDEESADIYRRGLVDFEQLSGIEQTQFDFLMRSYLTRLGIGVQVRREGLGPQANTMEHRTAERLLDQSGFRDWWHSADHRGLPRPIIQVFEEQAGRAVDR